MTGAGGGALGAAVSVAAVLGPERAALLELLAGLTDEQWSLPTPCPAWSVHELAVHLLHDDLRRLSGDRDGHVGPWIDAADLDALVVALDRVNEHWVATMAPTLSPRLTRELLEWSSRPTEAHLLGSDPLAAGRSVAWAGPGAHPNWLDVAREYTERWVHQQQLRDAVGRPGLTDEAFAGPVVDTFARALPAALPPAHGPASAVTVTVTGSFVRTWTFVGDTVGWRFANTPVPADTHVAVPVEVFWRRAVRMLDRPTTERATCHAGDPVLVDAVLDVRAAIVGERPPR